MRVDQADNFYEELLDKGKAAKLVKVDHGGHSMVDAAARETILIELEVLLKANIGTP